MVCSERRLEGPTFSLKKFLVSLHHVPLKNDPFIQASDALKLSSVVGISACDTAGFLQVIVDAVDTLVNDCPEPKDPDNDQTECDG